MNVSMLLSYIPIHAISDILNLVQYTTMKSLVHMLCLVPAEIDS